MRPRRPARGRVDRGILDGSRNLTWSLGGRRAGGPTMPALGDRPSGPGPGVRRRPARPDPGWRPTPAPLTGPHAWQGQGDRPACQRGRVGRRWSRRRRRPARSTPRGNRAGHIHGYVAGSAPVRAGREFSRPGDRTRSRRPCLTGSAAASAATLLVRGKDHSIIGNSEVKSPEKNFPESLGTPSITPCCLET